MFVAAFVLATSSPAGADNPLSKFFGRFHGFGIAEESGGPLNRNTERDFEMEIAPIDTGGFSLTWGTVKHKGTNPNALEASTSSTTSIFLPTTEPGVFVAAENGDPLVGDLMSWARVENGALIVYRLEVDRAGIPEMHIYRRTWTPKGMELNFTALKDGKPARNVRGRYIKE